MHKRALRLCDDALWELYKQLRNQITGKLRKLRRFRHHLNEHRGNLKEFWKILRLVLPKKNKSTCIKKLVVNNKEMTDSKLIVNALNSHFVGIGKSVPSEAYPDQEINLNSTPVDYLNEPVSNANLFRFQSITNEQAYKALTGISTTKAKDADDTSAKFIKSVAGQIAPSVAYLFNESFRLGSFLSAGKLARVSPLHKGGNSSSIDNQRPISVLPCLSKVYEDFANSQLQDYACESKMISEKQFAYKKFLSCNVALILLVDEWKWAIDNKKLTVAAFLDLRKAFDVMNHRILLNKLKNAGITGTAIQWFESYLTDRKQYVCWNGYSSDVLSVKQGVPQGSVLGPTLFSIYYDIVHSVITNSSCKLSADDIEINSSDSNIGSAVDNVNEDLVSVEKWLKKMKWSRTPRNLR